MHLCLFEDDAVDHLLPLVYTRPVYDLRVGMRTVLQRTRDAFGGPALLLHTRQALAAVTGEEQDTLTNRIPGEVDVLFANGRWLVKEGPLLNEIKQATKTADAPRVFVQGDVVVAAWVPAAANSLVQHEAVTPETFEGMPTEAVEGARFIDRLWDLVTELRPALLYDYEAKAKGYNVFERPKADIDESATLANSEDIIIAPEARVHPGAILAATDGPIFIAERANVLEGAVVRGPAYVGNNAQVKPLANVEGVSIGPWSKVGGEVHSSVIHSYSNKAHAGFLGNSYLGRWCNIGADTNTSNLKNDYGEVSLFNHVSGEFEASGQQFLGLIMGDHSKCGINTMFNTGTVMGIACNLYGAGFPTRFIPSFSWGGPQEGFTDYRLKKALRVAETVMARREATLSEGGRELLTRIFEETAPLRKTYHSLPA